MKTQQDTESSEKPKDRKAFFKSFQVFRNTERLQETRLEREEQPIGQNREDKSQQAQAEVNSIERSRSMQKASENKVISDEVFMSTDNDQQMPGAVDRNFLKVGKNHYHFKLSPDDLAFIDKGNKLETPSNSHMVAETLVRIAQRRGWDEIRVTGTETFRREAWYEAARRGITVRGYTPTEVDKAKLAEMTGQGKNTTTAKDNERVRAYLTEPPAKALEKFPELAGAFAAREAIRNHLASKNLTAQEMETVLRRVDERISADLEKGNLPRLNKEERAHGVTGKVIEHGAAKFNFQKNESASYFVHIETEKGLRTIWGKDLERVVRDQNIQPGQYATFKTTGTQQVTVNVNVYDKNTGAIVGTKPIETARNTWTATRADMEKTRLVETRQVEHQQEREIEI